MTVIITIIIIVILIKLIGPFIWDILSMLLRLISIPFAFLFGLGSFLIEAGFAVLVIWILFKIFGC